MSRPTSSTAIVNLGHRLLKIEPVLSISPPDANSKAAAGGCGSYDQARRETLEAHSWNFATKRMEVASDATAPTFEYTTRYQLPSDYIRMGRIGQDWDNPETDFEIEGDFLLCNVDTPLKLVYVYDITDVSKFSPKFITALSFKLAALMGYEMTGNATVVETMHEQFLAAIAQAQSVDGQNRPQRMISRSKLAAARQNTGVNRDWQHWGDT